MSLVVDAFTAARIVTTGADDAGDAWIELSHEAVIRGWPRLQAWIDGDRRALQFHRRLTEDAREWEVNDRDSSFLYRGRRLTEALKWSQHIADMLSSLEAEFLAQSRATDRRSRWRRLMP